MRRRGSVGDLLNLTKKKPFSVGVGKKLHGSPTGSAEKRPSQTKYSTNPQRLALGFPGYL